MRNRRKRNRRRRNRRRRNKGVLAAANIIEHKGILRSHEQAAEHREELPFVGTSDIESAIEDIVFNAWERAPFALKISY